MLKPDVHQLAETTTCRVEQLQNRAVPRIPGGIYQPPHICLRERPQQPPSLGARPHEARRDLIDDTAEAEEVEKRSQSPQVPTNNLARQIAARQLGHKVLNVMRPNPGEAPPPPVPQKLSGDAIVGLARTARIPLAHQPLPEAVDEFRVREPLPAHINRDKQVRASAGYMTEGSESQWIDLLYGTAFDICIR